MTGSINRLCSLKITKLYPQAKINQIYQERIVAYKNRITQLQKINSGIEPVVDPNATPEEQKQSLEKKEDDSFYYPVEAQINLIEESMSPKEAALFLSDYIDYYFDEYFKESETIYLNIDWKKIQFESRSFLIKGQILNLQQEKAAEAFLNKNLQKA